MLLVATLLRKAASLKTVRGDSGSHVWVFAAVLISVALVFALGPYAREYLIDRFGRDPGFVGAIIGAIVGGALTIGAQVVAAAQARRKEDAGLGLAIMFKLFSIGSRLESIVTKMKREAFEGKEAGMDQPWRYVRPSANRLDRVSFDPKELSVVQSLKDAPLLSLILGLDDRYNADLGICETLDAEAAELRQRLVRVRMKGLIGDAFITSDTDALRASINSLASTVFEVCQGDADRALKAGLELQERLRERYGVPDPPFQRRVTPEKKKDG